MSQRAQKIVTQPINMIFRYLQSKARIQVWLYEMADLRIEGRIVGFDEYMNVVLDDAEEVRAPVAGPSLTRCRGLHIES